VFQLQYGNIYRQYWECDKCGLRLHPGCIGRDPDETPADSSTTFWCEACLTAVVKVWPVDNFKEFIESGGVSDDEGYIIDATVILSLMHAGQTRWLQRHEAFLRCRNLPYSRYYGANVFSGDHSAVGYQEADSRLKEAESTSNRAMLAGLVPRHCK
ncbi:hypothetical protein MAR_017562, partial [Mya arenaria]